MNREQMIEEVAEVLRAPLEGEVSYETEARMILDAILPRVATVAEVEALPVATKLINDLGDVFTIHPLMLSGSVGWRTYLDDELHDRGPFMVIWQP